MDNSQRQQGCSQTIQQASNIVTSKPHKQNTPIKLCYIVYIAILLAILMYNAIFRDFYNYEVVLAEPLVFRYISTSPDITQEIRSALEQLDHPYEVHDVKDFREIAWDWQELQLNQKQKIEIMKLLLVYYYGGYSVDADTHCDYQKLLRYRPFVQECFYSSKQGDCTGDLIYCGKRHNRYIKKVLLEMWKKAHERKDKKAHEEIGFSNIIKRSSCEIYPKYLSTCTRKQRAA